jgi:hypothetical protein
VGGEQEAAKAPAEGAARKRRRGSGGDGEPPALPPRQLPAKRQHAAAGAEHGAAWLKQGSGARGDDGAPGHPAAAQQHGRATHAHADDGRILLLFDLNGARGRRRGFTAAALQQRRPPSQPPACLL